jgi:signal transduction histidine kinase
VNRAVFAYIVLVLAPSAALAVFAFRVAESEHRLRLEDAAARLREEAEALGRRIEAALADAARRAEAESVPGFAVDGRWLGYTLEPDAGAAEPPPNTDELRLFRLSLRGGESFEHAEKDPLRAFDAYAFYIPRIRNKSLRAQLELCAARSALAAGDKPLSCALLRDLVAGAAGLSTDEGLPIDLVALSCLLATEPADAASLRAGGLERLREAAQGMATPLIGRFARVFASEDPGLQRVLEQRNALENEVREHPEVLATVDAVLAGGKLLLARPRGTSQGAASAVREVRLAPVSLPPLDAAGLTTRLEPGRSPAPAALPGSRVVLRSIRAGESGSVVAALRVEDPHFDDKIAAANIQRNLQIGMLALLVLVTLGGGAALALSLARERRLVQLRARLLANVSHELKTPVTSIRMFSELLAEDGADAERTRRFGRLLTAESSRLSQLVENLLDSSRMGNSDVSLPIEPVDIAALLRRVAEAFELRAREKRVAFQVEGCEAAGFQGATGAVALVNTNAAAVERIALNLLDNALKYRRKDAPEIRLALSTAGDAVCVSVADNGIGIARRDRERIFDEFYRVRYDDYTVKGSGLGLSIARRLARKLGGDLTLESDENVGSTFVLSLPLQLIRHDVRTDPYR